MNTAALGTAAKKTAPLLLAAAAATVITALALALTITAGAATTANAQTCTGALQAVTTREPADAHDAAQAAVVVPIRPQGPQQLPRWDADQVRNAATITNTGRSLRLPPRAAVIAVAVAIQESSLNNLHTGDRDSLGLFQQRPSQGWGSAAQITDPVHASTSFYTALTKIHDWQTAPLTQAAQAVQRSAAPQAYARWEQAAGALVTQTWGTTAVTSVFTGCDSVGNDPAATFHPTHANPRTPAQAIAAARYAGTGHWRPVRAGLCDNFVAQTYGWGSSGSETALTHWQRLLNLGEAHPGDAQPPPGSLLFYRSGNPAGHVALYLGNGQIASTDITGSGTVGIVTPKAMAHWLGPNTYLGWTTPDFPSAGGLADLRLPGSPS